MDIPGLLHEHRSPYDQYEISVVNVEQSTLHHLRKLRSKNSILRGSHQCNGTTTVELTIAETQPSIKGATVTGSALNLLQWKASFGRKRSDFIEAEQKLVINTTERNLRFSIHKDISGCQIENFYGN